MTKAESYTQAADLVDDNVSNIEVSGMIYHVKEEMPKKVSPVPPDGVSPGTSHTFCYPIIVYSHI